MSFHVGQGFFDRHSNKKEQKKSFQTMHVDAEYILLRVTCDLKIKCDFYSSSSIS